ncbi:MAG: hypothetical protein NC118_06030 [Eubacterium sp.]|nr:hypothetical protein [Eubacterium sp.]
MIKHPHGDGIPFFAKKNAFQWNDPTFIGMVLTDGRTSAITLSDGVQSVINGRASVWLSILLNVVQTQILLGALFCLIMRFKSKNLYELFGGVMFLGGYLFHFFWESSSSYTIPYFVILIPYAVKGWLDMVRKADGMLAQYQAGQLVIRKTEKTGRHVVIVVVCLGLFAAFSRTNLYANTFGLDDGEDAKNQFYHYNQEEELEFANGYYLIAPCLNEKLVLTERDGVIETASASETEEQRIAVSAEGGNAVFRFRGSEEVLAVLEGETEKPAAYMDDSRNMYYDFTLDAEYRWMFMQAGENEYYIMMNGLALAYDEKENSVILEAFDGNDGQRWIVSACK